ncbi:MAG: hypothetical protein B7Z52_03760, partial [Burkholderiales bacterium 12-64-5]
MTRHRLRRLVPEASPACLALLDPARGPVEAPIRSEVFGIQRFRQHAGSLACAQQARVVASADPAFFPRLHENVLVLRETDRYLASAARVGYHVTPAAAWLLDNFHLIDAQLKEIHDQSPASYFRHLPVLVEAHLAGLPRIYGIAWAFVAHNDSAFDADLLAAVLASYQEHRELTLGELWALPTTLRVILIENLRRLAERVAANAAARELANGVSDRIERYTPADLDALLAWMDCRGVRRAFLLQVSQRLQDAAAPEDSPWHAWAGEAFADIAAERLEQQAEQASYNLSVSNVVTSLRTIGDARWRNIVSDASALVSLLETSPAFCAEDSATQDESLHAVERLARRCAQGEPAVARVVLDAMRASPSVLDPEATPGYWLMGDGRRRVELRLGLRRGLSAASRDRVRRWLLAAYLGMLAVGGIGLVAWTLSADTALRPDWWLLAAV